MRLVVSDSGPIRYLILCDAIQVLPQLYHELIVPQAVAEELMQSETPAAVRAWVKTLPRSATLRIPQQLDPANQLGQGERAAIALAGELNARQLLVDDRAARRIANERGLSITGTVGILELAAERGLLDLSNVLRKLLRTNFRINAEVIQEVLDRNAARRGG